MLAQRLLSKLFGLLSAACFIAYLVIYLGTYDVPVKTPVSLLVGGLLGLALAVTTMGLGPV